MLLQKGKFLVETFEDLNNLETDEDGLKRVIDLAYMGKFEYEGNSIPISRMFIEYYKDEYQFYETEIFSQNNERLYIFANSEIISHHQESNPNFIETLAKRNIDRNISIWDYIHHKKEDCLYDFWWNVEADYFMFFGEDKKDIINYFIESCYDRDGRQEGIKKKLQRVGYKF